MKMYLFYELDEIDSFMSSTVTIEVNVLKTNQLLPKVWCEKQVLICTKVKVVKQRESRSSILLKTTTIFCVSTNSTLVDAKERHNSKGDFSCREK